MEGQITNYFAIQKARRKDSESMGREGGAKTTQGGARQTSLMEKRTGYGISSTKSNPRPLDSEKRADPKTCHHLADRYPKKKRGSIRTVMAVLFTERGPGQSLEAWGKQTLRSGCLRSS